MSESQSRYSIVERLTVKKLSLIGEREEINGHIVLEEQAQEEAKNRLDYFIEHEKEDLEREKRNLDREYEGRRRLIEEEVRLKEFRRLIEEEVRLKEFMVKRAKEAVTSKQKTIDDKITAINEALERVEEVSKNAGTGNESPSSPEEPPDRKNQKP